MVAAWVSLLNEGFELVTAFPGCMELAEDHVVIASAFVWMKLLGI